MGETKEVPLWQGTICESKDIKVRVAVEDRGYYLAYVGFYQGKRISWPVPTYSNNS